MIHTKTPFSSDMLLQQKRKKKREKKSKKHLQNSSVGKGRSNSGERKGKARQILIFFVSFKKFFIASTKKRLKHFFQIHVNNSNFNIFPLLFVYAI